jgi:hypothetical protein
MNLAMATTLQSHRLTAQGRVTMAYHRLMALARVAKLQSHHQVMALAKVAKLQMHRSHH